MRLFELMNIITPMVAESSPQHLRGSVDQQIIRSAGQAAITQSRIEDLIQKALISESFKSE